MKIDEYDPDEFIRDKFTETDESGDDELNFDEDSGMCHDSEALMYDEDGAPIEE